MASSPSSSSSALPTAALVLKASCDERTKRLVWPAAPLQALRWDACRRRLAEALQFAQTDFRVEWRDDDGDVCEISSTADLHEALSYHISSDPSRRSEPVTMRVSVRVSTAVELSDFGSSFGSAWGGSSVGSLDLSRRGGEESEGDYYSGSDAASEYDEERSAWAAVPNQPRSGSASWDELSGSEGADEWSIAASSVSGSGPAAQRAGPSRILAGPAQRQQDRSLSGGSSRPYHSSSSPSSSESEPSDAETESGLGVGTNSSSLANGARSKKFAKARRMVAALDALALLPQHQTHGYLHEGIRCSTCGIDPIRGARFHCIECPGGRDFCAPCEAAPPSASTTEGHQATHLVLKLTMPVSTSAAASSLGMSLLHAQQRLYAEAAAHAMRRSASEGSVSASGSSSSTAATTPNGSHSHTTWQPSPPQQQTKCDYCSGMLEGVRYVCANCPLGETGEGYNLCRTCEVHSLACHDPAHFFLKIRVPKDGSGRLALQSPLYRNESLLPIFYKDLSADAPPLGTAAGSQQASQPQGSCGASRWARDLTAAAAAASSAADASGVKGRLGGWRRRIMDEIELRRLTETSGARQRQLVPLSALIHPSILCDLCYEVIEGPWLRCCNCTASHDLCVGCEGKVAHDPSHAFAVFKQPLDLDLFKSAIDLSADSGAARPLLPFRIV